MEPETQAIVALATPTPTPRETPQPQPPALLLDDPAWRIRVYCGDCLPLLNEQPAGFFGAILADPPYGISVISRTYQNKDTKPGKSLAHKTNYPKADEWDDEIPGPEYFAAIRRASREQVIWGGNFFTAHLPPSPSWIVWDKDNGANDFADCELAWTSHRRAIRKIVYRWNGMLQEPGEPKEARIHPTQKPVRLMRWVIDRYTEADDLICDPYGGSGSTAIAAMRAGRACWIVEKRPEYAAKIVARVQREMKREALFGPAETAIQRQPTLFEEVG